MRNKFNKNIFIYVIFAFLALYVLSMCVLFLWSFVSSLKSRINFVEDPIGLPIKWMFSTSVVPCAAKPAITRAAPARKSWARTTAPVKFSRPVMVAVFPLMRISAPMLASSVQ